MANAEMAHGCAPPMRSVTPDSLTAIADEKGCGGAGEWPRHEGRE
jgi:hypothetical protein